MDLTTPLVIKVFFSSPETELLKITGTKYPLTKCPQRTVKFYSIEAMTSYIDRDDENKQYGHLMANADEFITILSPTELANLIDKCR